MVGSEDTITVTLGDLSERVEARLRSGRYASASDVVRAALRALDLEALEDFIELRSGPQRAEGDIDRIEAATEATSPQYCGLSASSDLR